MKRGILKFVFPSLMLAALSFPAVGPAQTTSGTIASPGETWDHTMNPIVITGDITIPATGLTGTCDQNGGNTTLIDTTTDFISMGILAGMTVTNETDRVLTGQCTNNSGGTLLIDTSLPLAPPGGFVGLGVVVGMTVNNTTDGTTGIVTGFLTLTDPNDTLVIGHGMTAGGTNDINDFYNFTSIGTVTGVGLTGTCTADGGNGSLIDSTKDFVAMGITVGMTVNNDTDGSTGIVFAVAVTTLTIDAAGMSGGETNDTGDSYSLPNILYIAAGMGGAADNDSGDVYYFERYLRIGHGCDIRFQANSDDTHWGWDILRSEIIVYGGLQISGTFPESWKAPGSCGSEGATISLIDTTKDFVNEGVVATDTVNNTTDGSTGTVTGFATTVNINDTLLIAGGMSGGATNDAGPAGTCDQNGGNIQLIDTTKDFVSLGVVAGMTVNNPTDGSTGVVTGFTTTVNPNDTVDIAGGMSGGATNDIGDAYYIGDAYTVSAVLGTCDRDGSSSFLIDETVDFLGELIGPGAIVINETDNTEGIVTGILTTVGADDTLHIGGGMTDSGTNDPGDSYRVVVPATLTSTSTGSQGWFGIVFSDNTATGDINYANFDRSVYGINFTACSMERPPSVSNCTINDVSVGMYFDNESSPDILDTTIIQAEQAFSCWAFSAPTITNCNATNLVEDKQAVYATEYTNPDFYGCALSGGSVELDMGADVYMRDCSVTDAEFGIIGHEFKGEDVKVLSWCTMELENCNVIGQGDLGNGIEWDDNLDVLKVQYSRLGGFIKNVWLRWGTIDVNSGIYHMVGQRFAVDYFGWCTWPGFGMTLVDEWTNFTAIGVRTGTVVANMNDDAYTGTCDWNGGSFFLIDTTTDFSALAAPVIGSVVENTTIGDWGWISGMRQTVNPNDTLEIERGMWSGGLNDIGNGYAIKSAGYVDTIIDTFSESDTLRFQLPGMTGGGLNDIGDPYRIQMQADPNNADFGDIGGTPADRNWPDWYADPLWNPGGYSDGGNEFYGVQDPECLFNIECEQSGVNAPKLYQLDAWAEGNWWVTTNDTIISRYIWDNWDHGLLGLVHVFPHRIPDEKRTYSISGKILDNLGDPVEGVRVSVAFEYITGRCTDDESGITPCVVDTAMDFIDDGVSIGDVVRNVTDYDNASGTEVGVGTVTGVGVTGTCNGAGGNTSLIDSTMDFVSLGIVAGMRVENDTDGSVGIVTGVAVTTLTIADGMTGGATNDIGDAYNLPNILYVAGGMSGGVANDEDDSYIIFTGAQREIADITGSDGYYTVYGLLPYGGPGLAGEYTVNPEKLFYTFGPQNITLPITESDITEQDFDAMLPPPRVLSVSRSDMQDGAFFGLPGRTNWGKNSETTFIIIAGLNFRQTPSVFLRGVIPSTEDTPCSNVSWVTSTTLYATTPGGMDIGNYSIRIVNPDGQEVIWGNNTISGTCSADGGNISLIDDMTNFSDDQVGLYAYLMNDTDPSNGTVTGIATTTNPNDTLQVNNGMSGGDTNDTGDAYTVYAAPGFTIVPPPPPNVFSISPNPIFIDDTRWLTVTGDNFITGCDLSIDGFTWSALTTGGTSLSVWYTPGTLSAGTWPVSVTNPDGQTSTEPLTLTVNGPPPPTVSSIVPPNGPNNRVTDVTIDGTGFDATPSVFIGVTECINEVWIASDTVTAQVPIGITPGTYDVTVRNPDGQSGILLNGFTVDEPVLNVIGISPPLGLESADTDIIIVGENFKESPGPTVTVGATACTNVRVISTTCLLATVPSTITAGLYDVTIDNNDGQAAQSLTNGYTAVTTPTVSTVTILSGGGDANNTTSIQIDGADFAYIPRVEIGTAPDETRCTDVVFVSSAQLTANVPSGIADATYDVTVINPLDQSGTLAASYTVNIAPAGEPEVTSISPAVGTNDSDADITITGVNFTGATGVTVGGTACTNVVVVLGTEITATIPATTEDVRVGDYDVTVTTPAGTGTLTHGFSMGGSGTLNADTTLSRTVTLTGDVVIPNGLTLTVEPGSILMFDALSDDTSGGWDGERGEIRVYGRIDILGDADDKAAVTSNGGTMDDWLGIVFSDATASAFIEHADFTNGVYALSFESSFSSPITADYPRPWVHDVNIATCSTAIALNSSVGFTCPAIDTCSIDNAKTGISAGGTAAPIFTLVLFRNVSQTGLQGRENAIVTMENSSIVDAPQAISCPQGGTGEETNASILNIIFSVLGNGTVELYDSSTLTARMVTHLLFPNKQISKGITSGDAASLAWDYSNVVQGNSEGTGVDWGAAGALTMSYSVIEGWEVGVMRRLTSAGCGDVNLGDGVDNPGGNEFLGIMNPEATYNVANGNPENPQEACPTDLPAQYNWWLTADYSVIENYLYDEEDNPDLGDIDYSNYLIAPRTYSIAGRITHDTGAGVDRVQVVAYFATSHTDNDRIGMTDTNGYYTIYGLVPGDYTILAEKQGYAFAPPTLSQTVTDTDINGQDFNATLAPPTVYGIRRADGQDYPPYGNGWAYNHEPTFVVITGLNFVQGAVVYLVGPLPALTDNSITNAQFVNSTMLTATIQGGFTSGDYGVKVLNPDSQSDTLGIPPDPPAFVILDPPPPLVNFIWPDTVYMDYNETFRINGSNFYGWPVIYVGPVQGYYNPFLDPSPTETDLYFRLTAEDLQSLCDLGPQAIQVFNPDGQGSNIDVTLTVNGPPAPVVNNVTPDTGINNDVIDITIDGGAFQETPDVFLVHTVTGSVYACLNEVFVNAIQMTAQVPSGIPTGLYDIRVCNPSCSETSPQQCGELADAYTATEPPVAVIGISPPLGLSAQDTDIIIVGTNIKSTPGPTVTIDPLGVATVCTNVRVISSTCLLATVPSGMPAGLYDVEIDNNDAMAADTLGNCYTVITTPTVSSPIVPDNGDANNTTAITINGADFAYIPKVEIETSPAATRCTDVVFVSSSQLTANVPSGLEAGTYGVTVINPLDQSGSLVAAYTVIATPVGEPEVLALQPSTSTNDTATENVTITGTTLLGTTSVTVGTTPCENSGTCDQDGGNASLIDTTKDFSLLGVNLGMTVVNTTDGSTGTVTGISDTSNFNDTLDIAGGMSGGATNDAGDAYTVRLFFVVSETEINATIPAGIRVFDADVTVTTATGTGTLTHGFTMGGSGTLMEDTTLSGSVTLTGDIVIPEGVTLTIEPGSVLIFDAISDDTSGGWDGTRGEIRVYGRLNILGDPGYGRIAGLSGGAQPGDWLGVIFSDTAASGWIANTDITNAVYGLSFESSLSTPITADNPRPWVFNVNLANCDTGIALNSSVGFTCPALDIIAVDNATTGISAGGTAAPILTRMEIRNVYSVGLEAKSKSIVTMENSSIVDATKAVSCPKAQYPEPTNQAIVNVIFSVLGNGYISISDSSSLTARMVSHLIFPDEVASSGVVGEEVARLNWDYSNLVQGYSAGTGVDWQSAGDLTMSNSVVEGWGLGFMRRLYCGIVNLGDGLANPGGNEFLGIMNPDATFNVANGNPSPQQQQQGCSTDISAQFNWWLTTDYSVIENYLYDQQDNPDLGIIDYLNYRSEPRTYSVAGRITDTAGYALDRVQVVAHYSTAYTDNDRMGMTDGQGNYTIYGLIPGDYTILPEKKEHSFSPTSLPVTVTDTDINGQDFYGYPPPPTIYGITPNWGFNHENTSVIITGINFRNPPYVYMRGPLPGASTETPLQNVQWGSSTGISATVQGGFCAGAYSVRVTNPDGQTDYWINQTTPSFTVYNPPPPVIYGIDPVSVWQDSENLFTITGEYFYGPPTVCFGSACAGYTFEVATDTVLIVRVPAFLLECGPTALDVIVVNPAPPCTLDGVPSNAVQISVQCPLPTPTAPPPDTPTPTPTTPIQAVGLAPRIGLATPVQTPSVTPGTDIVVIGLGINAAPGPSVRLLSSPPAECFNIRLAGTKAVLATVPDGIAPGVYDVEIDNNDGQAAQTISNAYSVVAPPTVTGVVVNSGGGYNNTTTNITINGDDFIYLPEVEIGTTRCVDVAFVSPAELEANVPSGMQAGTYDVTVINPLNQEGTLVGGYTVLAPPPDQPSILTVNPDTGVNSETTDITVIGSDFPTSPTVRVGSTACTNVVRVDSTKITATVPASVIGLQPGDYDVTVTDLVTYSATLTKGFTLGGSGTLNPGDWSISRSISLSGDLVIPEDATLTVYPGVTLTFDSGSEDTGSDDTSGGWDNERGEIRLYGRLNILGEVDARVTITTNGELPSGWLGIVFSDMYATGLIRYADISNALYALWFRSCLSAASAGNPLPVVSDTSIATCAIGIAVDPSYYDSVPFFNRCTVSGVEVGVGAEGYQYLSISAPILASCEITGAASAGISGSTDAIITAWNSSVRESDTGILCTNTATVTLLLSAIDGGKALLQGASNLVGLMATIAGPGSAGIQGGDNTILDWEYSNVVQGGSGGTGVSWSSVAACLIRYSVIESWGTGVSGYGTSVNLGDGSPGTGYNDFIGNAAKNVANIGGTTLYAWNNWWLTTDPALISLKLTGDVSFIPYLDEQRTYSVEGNVADSSGQPLEGARVVAYYLPREPFANRDNDRIALTGEDGDYKLFGLCAGDYSIELLLNSGMSSSRYIKIYASDITGVDLVKGNPVVSSITPDNEANTGIVTATIRGNFFEPDCVVKLMREGETTVRGIGFTATSSDRIDNCQFDLTGSPPERWHVVVTNTDNTTGRLTAGFLVTDGQPTVSGISPSSMSYGDTPTVTVYGTNFYSTSIITVGDQDLDNVVRVSSTELMGDIPIGLAPNYHDVTVTNGDDRSATMATAFYVQPPPGGNVIVDSVVPNGGSPGDSIYIYGSGFAGIPEVVFDPGAHDATNEVPISSTEIYAKVPSGLTNGTWYDITVNNLDFMGQVMDSGTLAHAFRVGNPQTTVTSITPDYGVHTETTAVTIDGSDFESGCAASIGTTACTDVAWVTISQVTATVPKGINPGYHDVVVQNTDALPGNLRYGFRVDADIDLDLMGDWWEYYYWGDLDESGSGDWDGDGFSNLEEYRNNTNPLVNSDVDGDGMPDYWEDLHGLNKYDPSDAGEDADGDGFSNLEEFLANHRGGSDPGNPASVPEEGADWDGDGLDNVYELTFGLNPKVADGDDGDSGDPDGDGYANDEELAAGSNPMNPNSSPDNPDALAGTLAVVREEMGGDQNIYYYNAVRPGDWVYWDIFARNPSPLARDLWVLPYGNTIQHLVATDIEDDDVSEMAVFRMDGGGDPNLYIYSAAGHGEWSFGDAFARNPSPLARDFWMIPAGEIVAVASVDADGDGFEEAAVLERAGDDMNLYLYAWPARGDFSYWDAAARNPQPLARDFWAIPYGADITAMAALDADGDGVDELAIVRRENEWDYNLYLYRCPAPGDMTYWDAIARNPSPMARDLWFIPSGNDLRDFCGLDIDLDGEDEILFTKSTGDGDLNLYVYEAPVEDDWGYYDASARNPSPLARDLWIIPGANSVVGITSIR